MGNLAASPADRYDKLCRLFWSDLNYSRVNTPLSRAGWSPATAQALAEDPVLFAAGGEDYDFKISYSRLASNRLPFGDERPIVSRLLRDHPYALFVFSNHSQDRWHFLNVKVRDDETKQRVFRRLTVIPGIGLRTPTERITKLDVVDLAAAPPLTIQARYDEAFDKEPLTRDFFKRFDKALEEIKSDLERFQKLPSAEAYSQAQLLLERLIFLYFLQNRGWLAQNPRFLPNELKDYTAKPDAFTFYSEFLDKLFWTLASAPGSPGRLPGIPFLNGGLFDDDEFRQSTNRKANPPLQVRNRTFCTVFDTLLEAFNFTVTEDTPLNQEVAVDPEMLGKVFESIILHAEAADPDAVAPDKRKATGSYYTPRIVVHFICREVLYQYLLSHLDDFGVRQLAAALSPASSLAGREPQRPPEQAPAEESGSKLPHSKGWAPRLKTLLALDASDGIDDEKRDLLKQTLTPAQAAEVLERVKPLRCCDPAVGSGAFPVGLMHELVNLRRLLETVANGYVDPVRKEGAEWLHGTKADIVQNCLFGVDIQQQAIEICRLRLWLSLVVDYDLGLDPFTAERSQFSRAIERISQLPNLEMNFHRGDSLHDHISGVPVVILPDRASRHADEFKAIAKLGARLHQAKTSEAKKKLRLEILAKRLEVSQRILQEEAKDIDTSDSALDTLFGLPDSAADKRKRNQHELERLADALKKVEGDRADLEKLGRRVYQNSSEFYPKLRKLEGADFNSPFNFAWALDFPNIFGSKGGGFDIIVGNPPFVTARNPTKRELWRQRWPRVCYKNYQLVCPFFELNFGSLKQSGQLGFIVSNAFAKREFGKPLVEKFFPTVCLQKIIDCSGLMFPGHGTPTCLVFGRAALASPGSPIRVAGIPPGGGDLRTSPEESPLWRALEDRHDEPGFSSERVVIADYSRSAIAKWPWNMIGGEKQNEGLDSAERLASSCSEPIGAQFITGKDEAFVLQGDHVRRLSIPPALVKNYATGEDIRNWVVLPRRVILFPYDASLAPLKEPLQPGLAKHLRPYKHALEISVISGSTKKCETSLKWFEFRRLARAKFAVKFNLVTPHVATHVHFAIADHTVAFKEKAQAIAPRPELNKAGLSMLAGLLNASAALFRLKQVCFNKGAGEDEERDRFEFAGGKLEELPVPDAVAGALKGKTSVLAECLTVLSQACWERGQKMPSLALKKLFDKPGEAYNDWSSSLPGYVAPGDSISEAFDSAGALRNRFRAAQETRERLRGEMIALQEEMDWLVYAAYGLLPEDHPAVSVAPLCERRDESSVIDRRYSEPLDREQRPFRLWAEAEGDFTKAVSLIPADWPGWRRSLWEARLAAIRDNEHIRRIEQPVYKRRWDEQWKVKNQWRCGPVAYAAEFIDAFESWLREKAEWWLEHKKAGGPADLDDWALALWKDPRVQAAWEVAAENYALLAREGASEEAGGGAPTRRDNTAAVTTAPLKGTPLVNDPPEALVLPGMEAARKPRQRASRIPASGSAPDFGEFRKEFKRIIVEETVPENIPWAVPYAELDEKRGVKVPAKVKSIRGKLNVPRERFHLRGKSLYLWAGLQFK